MTRKVANQTKSGCVSSHMGLLTQPRMGVKSGEGYLTRMTRPPWIMRPVAVVVR